MFDPVSVEFRGPLTAHVEGFWQDLLRQSYAPLSGRNLLHLAAHFSRWLQDRSLDVQHITDKRVQTFVAQRRRLGYTHFLSPSALQPLLRYLRRIGVVAAPIAVTSPIDQFVEDYAAYLASERGLASTTIRGYSDFARRFLAQQVGGAALRWQDLKPAHITRFVLSEARRWSVGQVKHEITALRSLLRYLHAKGRIHGDLAGCVPAVAGWRLAGLPGKGLDTAEVRRVLQCCGRQSTVGGRNAAIVHLLLRLGLRASDAALLTLDDLDWRKGELILRGKSRRENRLPLPRDVGRVLAAYLRDGRPYSCSRRVFLRSRAPYGPLTTGGLIASVRSVLRRAGVPGGAHLLRHTVATQMLRRGASLPEIAHVLRHRYLDTTAIYAKVDFAALRTLVQPWPGGVR